MHTDSMKLQVYWTYTTHTHSLEFTEAILFTHCLIEEFILCSFVCRLPREISRITISHVESRKLSYWCSSKTVYQRHLFGLIIHPVDLCPFGKWSFIFPARTLQKIEKKTKNTDFFNSILIDTFQKNYPIISKNVAKMIKCIVYYTKSSFTFEKCNKPRCGLSFMNSIWSQKYDFFTLSTPASNFKRGYLLLRLIFTTLVTKTIVAYRIVIV